MHQKTIQKCFIFPKAPEPIDESWAPIILDATEFGPVCIQTIEENTYTESEDCLLLNVYVPGTKSIKMGRITRKRRFQRIIVVPPFISKKQQHQFNLFFP